MISVPFWFITHSGFTEYTNTKTRSVTTHVAAALAPSQTRSLIGSLKKSISLQREDNCVAHLMTYSWIWIRLIIALNRVCRRWKLCVRHTVCVTAPWRFVRQNVLKLSVNKALCLTLETLSKKINTFYAFLWSVRPSCHRERAVNLKR